MKSCRMFRTNPFRDTWSACSSFISSSFCLKSLARTCNDPTDEAHGLNFHSHFTGSIRIKQDMYYKLLPEEHEMRIARRKQKVYIEAAVSI